VKEESAFLSDLLVHTAQDDEDDASSLMVEDLEASAAADSTGRDAVHNLVATVEAATANQSRAFLRPLGGEQVWRPATSIVQVSEGKKREGP
jgi:hypothetical protein